MAVVRIEAFGGEAPSISGQALPGDLAQRNVNLYAGIREFRPLMADKDAGRSAVWNGAAAKTIYRTQRAAAGGYNGLENESANWILSDKECSYVKGQINDDTQERTYYTTDDGSAPPRVFDLSSILTPRKLGVPPPAKPTVAINTAKSFTLVEATEAFPALVESFLKAVNESVVHPVEDSVAMRYTATNGVVTPRAGPKSVYGLKTTQEVSTYLPESYRDAHWVLYADRSSAELEEVFTDSGLIDLGTVMGLKHLVPITALPYCLTPDKKDPADTAKLLIEAKLRAIKNPKTDAALLTDKQVESFMKQLVDGSRTELRKPDLVSQLDAAVKEFANLVLTTTVASLDVPLKALPEKPVYPTVPTVPRIQIPQYEKFPDQFEPGTVAGDALAYPLEWDEYEIARKTFNQKMAEYNLAAANRVPDPILLEKAQRAHAAKVAGLQAKADRITKEIEAEVQRIWENEIANRDALRLMLLDVMGGTEGVFGELDATRVKESRFYAATYVTDWGEESANSPITDMVEPTQYDSVTVTLPSLPYGRNIEKVRLYRSSAGSAGAAFQLVAELPSSTTTHKDEMKQAQLGEGLVTSTWLEPPEKLAGLTGMPNGIMAGFTNNTVWFSVPYAPYAWPVEYNVTTEHPIVGLATFGQTLFVGTTGSPYFISGSDSASMSALKMDSNQACVSRRSIVAVQGGVLYASPDGLCLADGRGISVVTQGLFTREDWQKLQPSSIIGAEHEGVYYMSYTGNGGGVFSFDLPSRKLTRLEGVAPSAVFVDRLNDALYYASKDTLRIRRLHGGTTRRTGLWRSGQNPFPQHAALSWAQVDGFPSADDPVVIRIFGDGYFIDYRGDVYEVGTTWKRRRDGATFTPGTPAHDAIHYTVKVTDNKPVRLPPGRWRNHEIEVESRARVTRVTLAGSIEELKAV